MAEPRAVSSVVRRARVSGRQLHLPARAEATRRQRERDVLVVRVESSRNEESTTGSPSSLTLPIPRPFRNTPSACAPAFCQSAAVIRRPSGRNHQASGRPEGERSPLRNCVRWKIGCSRRSASRRRVNSSSSSPARRAPSRPTRSRCPGTRRCCCRAGCGRSRRRPSSIGTPCESSSVVRKLRCWRSRSARTSGSSVGPLDAAVPGAVVVGAVAVALEVGLVVLLVVGDEVGQREAVVRGDEVDRGGRVAAVGLVEIARAREARGERGHARLAAPDVAHRVAVEAVPLRPEHREVADLIAARAEIPGLGDQLDLREHRVLVDDVEERREPVDVVELARQRRGEIEAEAVDVAVDDPVAQRVHDQPQHARMHRVEAVAGAREVHVARSGRRASGGSTRRCRCP